MPRRVLVASILSAAAVAAGAAAVADATTGVGTGLLEPKIKVRPDIGNQFVGAFIMTSIDRRARITAGQVMIDYTETVRPYIVGNFAVYGYDNDGRQSSSTSNLYPFRYVGRQLRANILTQGSNEKIGAVTFELPTTPNEMSGTITWRGGTYDVVYTREDDDNLDPTAPLPDARQIDPVAPKLTQDGFGAEDADWFGRYGLVPSTDDAGTSSGIYAPLVRAAESLSTGELIANSGSFALFPNKVSKTAPPETTAIVTLHGPTSTRVEYLTDFKWGDTWRTAVVRGGSTDGPVVGRFVGRARGDRIVGTLTDGREHAELTFVRTQKP